MKKYCSLLVIITIFLLSAPAGTRAAVGKLKIVCKPKAMIFIDGRAAALKPKSRIEIVVDAGTHRVSADASGYVAEIVKVNINPGETTYLELYLVKQGQNRDGIAKIPAGEVEIGIDSGKIEWLCKTTGGKPKDFRDAQPVHTVSLKAFSINKYEVTNQQYQKFVKAKKHSTPKYWRHGEYPDGEADYPVVEVSWKDAQAYCRWAKKRLPTEEEWEKAARGDKNKAYPFGPKYRTDRANTVKSNLGGPTITGRYEKGSSSYGCYDMAGNVWEWTASDWKPYPGSTGVSGSGGKNLKVVRGGSYKDPVFMATVFFRHKLTADGVFPNVGFRCAR